MIKKSEAEERRGREEVMREEKRREEGRFEVRELELQVVSRELQLFIAYLPKPRLGS